MVHRHLGTYAINLAFFGTGLLQKKPTVTPSNKTVHFQTNKGEFSGALDDWQAVIIIIIIIMRNFLKWPK